MADPGRDFSEEEETTPPLTSSHLHLHLSLRCTQLRPCTRPRPSPTPLRTTLAQAFTLPSLDTSRRPFMLLDHWGSTRPG